MATQGPAWATQPETVPKSHTHAHAHSEAAVCSAVESYFSVHVQSRAQCSLAVEQLCSASGASQSIERHWAVKTAVGKASATPGLGKTPALTDKCV